MSDWKINFENDKVFLTPTSATIERLMKSASEIAMRIAQSETEMILQMIPDDGLRILSEHVCSEIQRRNELAELKKNQN